ncbi:MAG: heparan-alpha-glucosaminide N-acetyltransferase domain-containing protein [Bacteroidota bacterium]
MQRFKALDVFRGMTVCLMIIVNTPGTWASVYAPFLHAPWHGFTPTDLVFPSFLFAVGNAFAFVKSKWMDKPRTEVMGKILKRTFLIFTIGYLLSWFPFVRWEDGELVGKPFSDTRFLGVLQRIALCYLGAALLILLLNKRQLLLASGILLFGYWLVMVSFGDLTLAGNFGRTLDLWVLGDKHMYHGEGIAFDPEGILSTFPAIVNVIGGYLTGAYIIRGKMITYEKVAQLFMWGLILMLGAYVWDLGFPINKKLWTSSYVLLTVGINLTMLGGLIYAIDFRLPSINFNFFETFGKNPLFIYVFSIFLVKVMFMIRIGDRNLYSWIYQNIFRPTGDYFGSLMFAIIFMLICWSVGKWLDNKKIYIKV